MYRMLQSICLLVWALTLPFTPPPHIFAIDGISRAQKALDLGDEPEEAGPTVSTLMLRLADGTRIRRRFLRSDVMGKVLDWADIQGVDLDAQRLSSSFPKVRSPKYTIELQLGFLCCCGRCCRFFLLVKSILKDRGIHDD